MRGTAKNNHDTIRLRAVSGWAPARKDDTRYFPLSAGDRAELAKIAQIVEYRTPGSQIFRQGHEASFLYVVSRGLVRVHADLSSGGRQIVAFHWPGDLFGLARDGAYVNSAEALTPCILHGFPAQRLERFLLENPRIQHGFLVKAIHDLRATQRQLIMMGRLTVPRRLAAFLLDCSEHRHFCDAATGVLALPVTREDIADYLGTSTESVTRAFGKLERDRLVRRLSARAIELQPDGLRRFAALD